MSSLRLELKPSPTLAAAIMALHAVAAFSVLLVLPGTAGWMLAAALLALGGTAAWSRALLRSGGSVRALEIGGAEITIHLARGESSSIEVARRRYVSRVMVALPIPRPVRQTLLVTRDMLDKDSFRALRIWALWGKVPGAGTPRPANQPRRAAPTQLPI